MKQLESSPHMGKAKYTCAEFSQLVVNAVLYCVYDKSVINNKAREETIYPSRFFLEIKEFGTYLEVTSHEKEQSGLLLTIYNVPAKLKNFNRFLSEIKFSGKETDVDAIMQKPYPFYPRSSYVKTVNVRVSPEGFDEKGQVVWHIVW